VLSAVLLDLRLPDGDGLDVLKSMKKLQPDLQVIMLTGHGTIESAIDAMKNGAFDYLTKPCNLSELEVILEKAVEQRKLVMENSGLRQVVHRQTQGIEIIGESSQMKTLLEMTKKAAQSDATILIQGETGVGKELIARALHLWNPRSAYAYVPLNAAAIPESLLESELFGHEKGAFSGAGTHKLDLVELADHGTLFLDEIGEMPLSLQAKLLRFLETGEFRRVGDNRLRTVDVRIVTATNRDLLAEVKEGRFRQDLYYRLNGLILEVPPLRERREDIFPLVDFYLQKFRSPGPERYLYSLSPETQKLLLNYDFPGNVRELAHLIQRGVTLANGQVIFPVDLWPNSHLEQKLIDDGIPLYHQTGSINGYPTLEDIERDYILETLKTANGNRAQAAKMLGISVRNLYRKLDQYGR
ncbi:MAG TPA: sigma-54-dependent Fis family transcriptional regulator, partial [Desulfosporosinus sp.]|nr:sigma-54-dependent Fis family transcriptional regulator [Desulfosporosinus sp.]